MAKRGKGKVDDMLSIALFQSTDLGVSFLVGVCELFR